MTIGLAILDMDGTLLSERSVDVFCEKLGVKERLRELDKLSSSLPAYRIGEMIAKFFAGVARRKLEALFDSIPLNPGAVDFVNFLRRSDFFVAVATDSYEFLAERLAKRITIDAVYGNEVEIRDGILTGVLLTQQRCLEIEGCREYAVCKLWFMKQLRESVGGIAVAVGDGDSDFCMIKEADIGIAYRPRSKSITTIANIVASSFENIKPLLQQEIQDRAKRNPLSRQR